MIEAKDVALSMPPGAAPSSPAHRAAIILIAWMLAVITVVGVRYRGEWDLYAEMHRRLAAAGVPGFLRNLDSLMLFVAAAFLGALIVRLWCGSGVRQLLALRRGRPGWVAMVLVSLIPMVCGGLVLAGMRWTSADAVAAAWPRLFSGVIRAPIAEEMLFRGLLGGVCAAAIGWRGRAFWLNAAAASMLFAAIHVPWNTNAVAEGWPTLLVTGIGGLWYVWLLSRWRSLWVPMTLHAGMNLGWLLAQASGGAGGGGWTENILRAMTIAIASWWTIRRLKGCE